MARLSNYSRSNVTAHNLVFKVLQVLKDGGGIFPNGIKGSSFAYEEQIDSNVVLQ